MMTPSFHFSTTRPTLPIHVGLERYEDSLRVTEVQPFLDYLLSGSARRILVGETLQRLRAVLEDELAAHGAIHVSKDTGLFVAKN